MALATVTVHLVVVIMSSSSGASAVNSNSTSSILSKLCSFQSKPSYETFPELPDMIIWIRIVLAVTYGISLGLRNQTGFAGILFALNVVTFLPIVYINSYLNADTDSYKNGLNFVGVPNAMATCVLVWIIIFTHEHSEEESAFAAATVQKIVGTSDAGDASDEAEFAKSSVGNEAAAAEAVDAATEAESGTDTEF